jgi:hypothetical protein
MKFKFKNQLVLGIIGLNTLISFPVVAQTNLLENFFAGTPPYNGDRITRPLNPALTPEDIQDLTE